MGVSHQGFAAARLLCQRVARCDGSRYARFLRRVFRNYRRSGVRVVGCGGHLGSHRAGPSGRTVGRGSDAGMSTVRIVLPAHLRTLAHLSGEAKVDVAGPVTPRSVLDALEAAYPVLQGTIRDHVTLQRRAFVRYFACEQDLSLESPDTPLPAAVASGAEPFLVVGAIAGGQVGSAN